MKALFEALLHDETIQCRMDEQVIFNRLSDNDAAVLSLLLASGYIKSVWCEPMDGRDIVGGPLRMLRLTNNEVKLTFQMMVQEWFQQAEPDYAGFIKAFLEGDLKGMNFFMNRLTIRMFSYFDTGKGPMGAEPERFYHGFVLGLLVELENRYIITSNRESGYGRYDVMLEPKNKQEPAMILEFKVHDEADEADLEATVEVALVQIEKKQYAQELVTRGIPAERIHSYGFAFEGKKVLIGEKKW